MVFSKWWFQLCSSLLGDHSPLCSPEGPNTEQKTLISGKRNSLTNSRSPPKTFMGDKIAGTDDFACFFLQGKSNGSRGLKMFENALQGVPVRRFNFPESRLKFSISLQKFQSRLKSSISTFRIPPPPPPAHKNRGLAGRSLEICNLA